LSEESGSAAMRPGKSVVLRLFAVRRMDCSTLLN